MKNYVSIIALAGALAGCTVGPQARQTIGVNSGIATAAMNDTPPAGVAAPIIRHTDDMYFGVESFRKRRGAELPAKVDRVTVRSAGDVDIQGFAAITTRATGIPIALNVERTRAAAAGKDGQSGGMSLQAPRPTMPVIWEGPLSGLLDLAAAKFGVDWEYTDGVVQMSDERTETFVLHALPTTGNINAALALTNGGRSGGGGGGGGGASDAGSAAQGQGHLDAAQKAALDVWKDVQSTIQVIVGDRGRFAITPSNGTITITAGPSVITQVAHFVRQQNEILTRQVFVRVKVYSIDIADTEDSELNLKLAAQKIGLGFMSAELPVSKPSATFTANVINGNSEFAGSSAVIKALSTAGRTSLVSELTLTALNNRPVTKQDVRNQSYVEKTSVNVQGLAGTTTTEIEPGLLSTGFSVSVLPRIISENRILLGYTLNLSSLIGLERINGSNGSFVQLPTVDSSGSMQETMLRSGEVLVLMGYLSDQAVDRRQGTGHPDNFLLGGARSASKSKRRMVITMEPTVMAGGDN